MIQAERFCFSSFLFADDDINISLAVITWTFAIYWHFLYSQEDFSQMSDKVNFDLQ